MVERIGLKDAIVALREELIASVIASKGERIRFEVGEITMEFQIEVERSTDVKGGIKFWVAELGAGGTIKNKEVHKVVIPLKPVDTNLGNDNPRPVLTGDDEERK